MQAEKQKRRKPISALSLSKGYWESLGWIVGLTERWVYPKGRAPIKFDLYGFADAIAFKPGQAGMLAIQACGHRRGGSDVYEHMRKMLLCKKAEKFLTVPGNRIILMGWGRGTNPGEFRKWFEWIEPKHFEAYHRNEPIEFTSVTIAPETVVDRKKKTDSQMLLIGE